MKTGAYWFKFFTDKEQMEFKEICGEYIFQDAMKNKEKNFENFTACAFFFEDTPQGYDYWFNISQRKVK